MASSCRCSYLSVMSSPPKCLWIGRQTKVNALVGNNDKNVKITIILILSLLMFYFISLPQQSFLEIEKKKRKEKDLQGYRTVPFAR